MSLKIGSLCSDVNNFEQRCHLENFIVIWLDRNVDEIEGYLKLKHQLRQTVNYLKTFNNADACVDYMTDAHDKTMFFLIVSDTIGTLIIPHINELPQLLSVYIFCLNECEDETWFVENPKVRGPFFHNETIFAALTNDIHRWSNSLVLMTFLTPVYTSFENKCDLNKLEASFMYAQLLKDILIGIKERADYEQQIRGRILSKSEEQITILITGASTDKSRQDIIDLCREEYGDNVSELKKIEEFEKTYTHSDAIRWYTRDCFLYRMLNKALRQQDIEVLYKMRFFITDLHNQIQALYSQSTLRMPMTVYRGQAMTSSEFKKLKQNVGGLLSMNSFISTTTDRETALSFVYPYIDYPETEAILFEINIYSMEHQSPFANIAQLSYMPMENEVLFSLGIIFRIESVVKSNYRVWNVTLKLCRNEDEQLKALTSYIRTKLGGTDSLTDLVRLMVEMGEYSKAEKFHQLIANDAVLNTMIEANPITKATFYNIMGFIYNGQGNSTRASEFYKMALEIIEKSSEPTESLAVIHNNIGLLYYDQGNFTQALENLTKALEVSKSVPNITPEFLAKFHKNIGLVYEKLANYSKALDMYLQTLNIELNFLPQSHPDFACTYNNIGMLFEKQGQFQKALAFYWKALEIQKNSLPPTHISLAIIYHNIGSMLLLQNDYQGALDNFTAELEILLRTYDVSHAYVRETQLIIDSLRFKL